MIESKLVFIYIYIYIYKSSASIPAVFREQFEISVLSLVDFFPPVVKIKHIWEKKTKLKGATY